jgi:hypothetical protein
MNELIWLLLFRVAARGMRAKVGTLPHLAIASTKMSHASQYVKIILDNKFI